ncbi:magnesium transporter, putative [Bodo saltans]|uniref:Magnesium transporter, putative n=1 Tax=Bodo saltans TaxID=75058 RepID=A0A0S4JQP5_BODSA|nr:magnesium transporter, putative [Bodo saltans]|eukprot:CUG91626.1 magnesium transporter, putative [Bodo saltans]
MKILFYIGLALLGHSIYAAFSMQDALQAHHHGAGGGLAFVQTLTGATTQTGASLPLWIAVEVLLGFALALVGYIAGTKLHMARLSDTQAMLRYENAVYTQDFFHFNHRGAVVSARQ